jgi:hypothetical protein
MGNIPDCAFRWPCPNKCLSSDRDGFEELPLDPVVVGEDGSQPFAVQYREVVSVDAVDFELLTHGVHLQVAVDGAVRAQLTKFGRHSGLTREIVVRCMASASTSPNALRPISVQRRRNDIVSSSDLNQSEMPSRPAPLTSWSSLPDSQDTRKWRESSGPV